MRKRHILITGAGFENQGAFLMLRAVAEQIRTRFDAVPVVGYVTGDQVMKREHGLASMWPARVLMPTEAIERSMRGKGLLSKLPFVSRSEIAAVFDASGFAFGDQWASADLGARANEFEGWSRRGVSTYMLPQAFGPFDLVAEASRRAIGPSRLIFARDPESRDHVGALLASGSTGQVELSPDFTGLVTGQRPQALAHLDGAAAIVPNANIFDRAADDATRDRYLENLRVVAAELRSRGLRPYGLCHAGAGDRQILERLRGLLDSDLEIVSGVDGIELKGVLARASFVCSGRFHASISSMHSGVPTLVHGWSHKYQHLCDEWGVPELQEDPYADTATTVRKVQLALEEPSIPERLAAASARINLQTKSMWDTIERRVSR